MALSSVAVGPGPLNGEVLKHTVSLCPNSCTFEFRALKYTNHHPPFFGIECVVMQDGTAGGAWVPPSLRGQQRHSRLLPRGGADIAKRNITHTHPCIGASPSPSCSPRPRVPAELRYEQQLRSRYGLRILCYWSRILLRSHRSLPWTGVSPVRTAHPLAPYPTPGY